MLSVGPVGVWCTGYSGSVRTINADAVRCVGSLMVTVSVGRAAVEVYCVVIGTLVDGIDAVLGVDLIESWVALNFAMESYEKCQSEGDHWDDGNGDKACRLIRDIVERVMVDDPVKGLFH
ncbi:hypothetical protein SK128_014268, partial [Halocaridina rubra]